MVSNVVSRAEDLGVDKCAKCMSLVFLGIDPGLIHTGWAVVMKSGMNLAYVKSGVIYQKKSHEAYQGANGTNVQSIQCFAMRLTKIFYDLCDIIKTYKPNAAAIENVYVNLNCGSSLKLAQARAAALLACGVNDICVSEYQAKTIKKMLVGSGSADKEQVVRMINLYLRNITEIKSADEADAIAIAICHAQLTR